MCNKRRFNKIGADLALVAIRCRRKKHRREQRRYWCPECRAYHLTSQKEFKVKLNGA